MAGQLTDAVNKLVWAWSTHENEYLRVVPQAVIDKVQELATLLPQTFMARVTGRRSIQIDNFESRENGYMEFEVFRDETRCMFVPMKSLSEYAYNATEYMVVRNKRKKYNKEIKRFVANYGEDLQ